jgi:DNA invertase Pin-like site-specific DNA recombinase
MSLGKVTVWQMSEEERLAYIKKHPIIPVEKPKGTGLTNISEMQVSKAKQRKKENRILDTMDLELFHDMYVEGNRLEDIANTFNISIYTVHSYLTELRKKDPEKWAFRKK